VTKGNLKMAEKKYDHRKYRKNYDGTSSSTKSPYKDRGMSIHNEIFGTGEKSAIYVSRGYMTRKKPIFDRGGNFAR